MILSDYSRIKERCDLEYQTPIDKNFILREFGKIKWSNTKNRNFFMIVKILAENGYCTINDIIDKDGLSKTIHDKKKRHDVYDRVIKGQSKQSMGLVDKWIIIAEDKNWKIKRNNRYRLTIFGMLYAIHLFSDVESLEYLVNTKYNSKMILKNKKNIIEALIKNYSDMLPLVFGRWDFLTKEFGTLVNFLVEFSHISKDIKSRITQSVFLNSDVTHLHGWMATGLSWEDELSVLFFAYIAMQENQYKIKFSKDKKMLKIYKEYLKFLKKRQHIESLRVRYHEAVFNNKIKEAKNIGVEMIEVQGLSADSWAENFDTRPDMR